MIRATCDLAIRISRFGWGAGGLTAEKFRIWRPETAKSGRKLGAFRRSHSEAIRTDPPRPVTVRKISEILTLVTCDHPNQSKYPSTHLNVLRLEYCARMHQTGNPGFSKTNGCIDLACLNERRLGSVVTNLPTERYMSPRPVPGRFTERDAL